MVFAGKKFPTGSADSDKILVTDDDSVQVLCAILAELKILNTYMSLFADHKIEDE